MKASEILAKQVLIENSLVNEYESKENVEYINSIDIDMRENLGVLRNKIADYFKVKPDSFKIRRSRAVFFIGILIFNFY